MTRPTTKHTVIKYHSVNVTFHSSRSEYCLRMEELGDSRKPIREGRAGGLGEEKGKERVVNKIYNY